METEPARPPQGPPELEDVDPAEERAAAEKLQKSLEGVLGERLKAIYRFGSDVGRGKGAGRRRLLVLVEHVDRPLLDEVQSPILEAQKAGVRVRIDSVRNLVRGSDAFPAFTLELRDHRELICGEDVLEQLDVEPAHLRLHVEQGLRSMRRDLVSLYLQRTAKQDGPELRRGVRKLMFLLEGALIAAGETPPRPPSFDAVVDASCDTLLPGHDREPWEVLKAFDKGEQKIGGGQGRKLYGAYLEALSQIISVVDQLEAATS